MLLCKVLLEHCHRPALQLRLLPSQANCKNNQPAATLREPDTGRTQLRRQCALQQYNTASTDNPTVCTASANHKPALQPVSALDCYYVTLHSGGQSQALQPLSSHQCNNVASNPFPGDHCNKVTLHPILHEPIRTQHCSQSMVITATMYHCLDCIIASLKETLQQIHCMTAVPSSSE